MKIAEERVFRILMADDNPADIYLIEQALRENGIIHDLLVAEDGSGAMEILNNAVRSEGDALDLILLDFNLPQHDGPQILQFMRQSSVLRLVPVVIFTSSDSPAHRLAAIDAGASRFIRKPSGLKEFMAVGAELREILADGPKL